MNEEETYEMLGQKLVDLVEEMEKNAMDPLMASTLLLDKAIDLAFFLHVDPDNGSFDESAGRLMIQRMIDEKAEHFRQRPSNN